MENERLYLNISNRIINIYLKINVNKSIPKNPNKIEILVKINNKMKNSSNKLYQSFIVIGIGKIINLLKVVISAM
jgi:hypothetical protein